MLCLRVDHGRPGVKETTPEFIVATLEGCCRNSSSHPQPHPNPVPQLTPRHPTTPSINREKSRLLKDKQLFIKRIHDKIRSTFEIKQRYLLAFILTSRITLMTAIVASHIP